MAEVLVLVEHSEGAVKKVTAELITAARALGEPSAVTVPTANVCSGEWRSFLPLVKSSQDLSREKSKLLR